MKSFTLALLLLSAVATARAGSSKTTFLGEISDTQCAMNVHSLSRSHEEMITKQSIGTDAASCARQCVRRGGEWVLRAGEDVYRLKNQAEAEPYGGQKVKVTGTFDPKTKTIDNTVIEAVRDTKKSVHQK